MDKNENKRVDINVLNKCYVQNTADKNMIKVDVSESVHFYIMKSISVDLFASAVTAAVNSCFDKKGDYIPWMKDIALMHAVLNVFTNIDVGSDLGEEFFALTVTNLYDIVTKQINQLQLSLLQNAFEEGLLARLGEINCAREKELDEALTMLRFITQKYNEVAVVFKEVMGADLSTIVTGLKENAGRLSESVKVLKDEFDKYLMSQGDTNEGVREP